MSFVQGTDRQQMALLPPCIEDYVPENAPVRFLDAFVRSLDLAVLGFQRTQPAETGRPAYDPADLLRLYLYGYLNRIRSSRRLEAESGRNLELIWLLRGLQPDFKTIADFRKDNRDGFRGVLRQFNLLCRKCGLFGAELLAIDGSKFKALNSPSNYCDTAGVEQLLRKINENIEAYLRQMDQDDEQTQAVAGRPTSQELAATIASLQTQKGQCEQLLKQLHESGEKKLPLADQDSRVLKVGVGYNVQIAVDDKHHLIVEQEVTQQVNDRAQLAPMAIGAKEQLGVASLKVVADGGYHESDQLEACEKAQITTYVPTGLGTSGQSGQGRRVFAKQEFGYDPGNDTYQCPAGQRLVKHSTVQHYRKQRSIYYNIKACAGCALKAQCTTHRYRKIARLTNEAVIERAEQRVRAHPEIMRRRKAIVEHCFATMKSWGFGEFVMRGLDKVRAEFSLVALAYNLKRAINAVGSQTLHQGLC
jgi:transposase